MVSRGTVIQTRKTVQAEKVTLTLDHISRAARGEHTVELGQRCGMRGNRLTMLCRNRHHLPRRIVACFDLVGKESAASCCASIAVQRPVPFWPVAASVVPATFLAISIR